MDTKLYPGIAFSPQAALADNIGAADTILRVTDVSAFPEAPNLATIGTDEGGETVLYAAKTADALSGCVRGVEGRARSWSAGEAVGRNFTAKDHNDLISAVLGALDGAAAAQTAAETAQGAAQTAQDAAQAAQGAAAAAEDQAASAAETAAQAAQDAARAKEDAQTASDAAATAQGAAEGAQTAAQSAGEAAQAAALDAKEAKEAAQGAATMEQVNGAIRAAVLDSWEGSY